MAGEARGDIKKASGKSWNSSSVVNGPWCGTVGGETGETPVLILPGRVVGVVGAVP